MDFTYPAQSQDPGKYLTDEMPRFIGAMVKLRDELAVRQGALTAVEDTHQLRNEAQATANKMVLETEQTLQAAREQADANKAQAAELKARKAQLDAACEKQQALTEAATRTLDEQTRVNKQRSAQLEAQAEAQAATMQSLKDQQAELDGKVRSLQAKVAALAL